MDDEMRSSVRSYLRENVCPNDELADLFTSSWVDIMFAAIGDAAVVSLVGHVLTVRIDGDDVPIPLDTLAARMRASVGTCAVEVADHVRSTLSVAGYRSSVSWRRLNPSGTARSR